LRLLKKVLRFYFNFFSFFVIFCKICILVETLRTNTRSTYKHLSLDTWMEISLSDFPDDIYILLEDNFRKRFFKEAYRLNGGSRKLCKLLSISRPSLESWRRGRQNSTLEKNIQYCPLGQLRKICSLCKGSKIVSLSTLEINISAYKANAAKLKVKNPILPIKFDYDLGAIIGHLLGDGTAQETKKRTSSYCNTSRETVTYFIERLKCFGKITENKLGCYQPDGRKFPLYRKSFPKAITKILINRLKINFDWDQSKIPDYFLRRSKEFKIGLIRAFFIDEGHVKDNIISFVSGNERLLSGIRIICIRLNYKVLQIKEWNKLYHFKLKSGSFKRFYTDMNSFGAISHKEKRMKLEHGNKLINQKWKRLNLEQPILNLLKARNRTAAEISYQLTIRRNSVFDYLTKLSEQGLVERFGKQYGKGGAILWGLSQS